MLTLEYAPGIKVDDCISLEAVVVDIVKLNQLGICCYLKQLLIDGFFQADPHPGNLVVTEDGSLIFYDFGMMGEMKSLAKDQMVKTFFAVMRKDADEVLIRNPVHINGIEVSSYHGFQLLIEDL